MGILASVIANVHRDPDKRREPFKAADFMPKFGEEESIGQSVDDLSDEERVAFLVALNAVFGGKDLRGKSE